MCNVHSEGGFLTDACLCGSDRKAVVVRCLDNCLMKLSSIIILPLFSVVTCFTSEPAC